MYTFIDRPAGVFLFFMLLWQFVLLFLLLDTNKGSEMYLVLLIFNILYLHNETINKTPVLHVHFFELHVIFFGLHVDFFFYISLEIFIEYSF